MHTAWAVFGKYLVDIHRQARPDPRFTETGEIIQTLVFEYPPLSSGHMSSMQGKIRTIL